MRKLRENVALPHEPFRKTCVHRSERKFQGNAAFERSIRAFRQPDHTHAAMAEFANQTVRPDRHVGREAAKGGFARAAQGRQRIQKRARGSLRREQLPQRGQYMVIFGTEAFKPAWARLRCQIQPFIQQLRQCWPVCGIEIDYALRSHEVCILLSL